MTRESELQYARSVGIVNYARSHQPAPKHPCPKCGSEMTLELVWGGGHPIEKLLHCRKCERGHSEKVKP